MRSLVFALALATAAPAVAQTHVVSAPAGTPAVESIAARRAVQRQLDALSKADPRAVYLSSSLSLRAQFPDEDTMLGLLSRTIPVAARSKDIRFGAVRPTRFGLAQAVELTAPNGEPWMAFFLLERDTDGLMRVANIIAVRQSSTPV